VVKRGGGEAVMDIIIIILALDIEVMMMNLVLVVIDIKHHHHPAPAVVAVIAQWTLMLSEMLSVILAVVKRGEEVVDTIIALIEATVMSIMHRNALNRVVLTLVTHPLLEMTTITLHTVANALAHLILKLRQFRMPWKICLILPPNLNVDLITQAISVVHLDLSMELRCSDLLLIL